MIPVDFPEANHTLLAGDIPHCSNLQCYKDDTQIVSKWRMSWRDRISALVFGSVFLHVLSSNTSPPVSLQVRRNVFTEFPAVKDYYPK